jgi:hypothetical protein
MRRVFEKEKKILLKNLAASKPFRRFSLPHFALVALLIYNRGKGDSPPESGMENLYLHVTPP